MRGGFISQLRELISIYWDNDNKAVLKSPDGESLNKYGISKGRNDVLMKLTQIIMETKYTNNNFKEYLLDKKLTMPELAEKVSKKLENVKQDIYRNANKIKRDFGENIVRDMLYYDDTNLKEYREKVEKVYSNYFIGCNLRDSIYIKLNKNVNEVSELSDEEFKKLVAIVRPYSRVFMDKIASSISVDMEGYIKYLEDINSELTEIDKDRLAYLKEVLYIKDNE